MILSWLQRRRRERILGTPFPPEWLPFLERNVVHYQYLTDTEKARLRDDSLIFMAEKHWEGCAGLTITDEMKVTISAQAMLLVLGLEHNYFDRVLSILVYPTGYRAVNPDINTGELIPQTSSDRLGEAHYRGPVILSWSEVLHDGQHPERGHNLVYHEFAHQLDMLDGVVNGTPPLQTPEQQRRWEEVMTREYELLIKASEHHHATLLDKYGTTNEAEFFAVATECFFDKPAPMAHRHPQLYDLLREYFKQDPAARVAEEKSKGSGVG